MALSVGRRNCSYCAIQGHACRRTAAHLNRGRRTVVRELLVRALGSEGYDVVGVGNGPAALDAVEAATACLDLVIANTYLPHLSGRQLVAYLQSLFPDLPILHLDDLSRPRAGNGTDPSGYVPFTLGGLAQAVRKLLTERL